MPVPKLLVTAALFAANMAINMTRKIEGPRLDDLKVTSGDYGGPLPMVWALRRLPGQIIWAEELREEKVDSKSKGGKQSGYKYYGTFAVAICGHEIEAVRRIWADTHLVYDLSKAGPVTIFNFGQTGNSLQDYITIYLGTETQQPDPRIQATVEAEHGEGSCPAYRGTAYVVFKDVPLEKFGNRIPQIECEIVGQAGDAFPTSAITLPTATSYPVFSPDYAIISTSDRDGYSLIDTAARVAMVSSDFTIPPRETFQGHAFLRNGTLTYADIGNDQITQEPDGQGTAGLSMSGLALGTADSAVSASGDEIVMYRTAWATSGTYIGEGYVEDFHNGHLFRDTDGDVWLVARNAPSGPTTVKFRRLTGGTFDLVVPLAGGAAVYAFHYSDADNDHFVLAFNNTLYRIGRFTGDILGSRAPDYADGLWLQAFKAISPGSGRFFIGFEEISSVDLSQIEARDKRDWVGGSEDNSRTIYDPINHALIDGWNTGTIRWHFLDRISAGDVTLGQICSDVAEWCGVQSYGFADLDQPVDGWSATRGQASNILEPLLDIFDSEIAPHDFTITGKKRAGVATGTTLLTEKFAGKPRYAVKLKQAAELPRAVVIDFADTEAEQQPNSARAARPLASTDAKSERKFDLTTYATDPDDAIQKANRYFRRIWNEREELTLSLTAQELALEPTDVRNIELDGETASYRCIRTVIKADDTIETEWRRDFASLALLDGATGAGFDGRRDNEIPVPLLSRGFVLDIPLIEDSDNTGNPVVYPFAAPYVEGTWPGAVIYQAVDGEYTETLAEISPSQQMSWGSVSTAMPYANPNLWDRGTALSVTMNTGVLAGISEATANADPSRNLAAIGREGRWEIVQFTTATLTGENTYTVSGFKRGRRGTEWAAELHEAGDYFILLNREPAEMGLSEVGTDVSFKAITVGRTEAGSFPYDIEPYTGASLKPYAPVHLEAVKDGSGDWVFNWVRRTRIGGAWTSGTTIPLSENSEEYEVDILDGESVVRTITVTSPSATYTAAQQTSDGGDVPEGSLEYRVYQISDDVNRGFPAYGTA